MKKVLVTGAGGSIGSALCRALACEQLVMYEQSEYALYTINEALSCNRLAVLGDIRDIGRLAEYMRGVDTVFHCAAYKHVPLLEGINASQAFKNNVEGTRIVLEAARLSQVRSVVVLSTDKAINPKSAMGRSKKAAEEITRLDYNRTVARLGNIFDTSGSVVPKFRAQIERGGPITVTHPEATRYFISMQKAIAFLIDCAKREPGSYQIDMGEPVRIVDLALKLVRELSGGRDIAIEYTGLRPGEKLHEDIEAEALA